MDERADVDANENASLSIRIQIVTFYNHNIGHKIQQKSALEKKMLIQ